MADKPRGDRPPRFNPKEVMLSAIAVPFPTLVELPDDRVERSKAIIANMEKYDGQVRRNIINHSTAFLKANPNAPTPHDYREEAELFEHLAARRDRDAGDIYAVKDPKPGTGARTQTASAQKQDPRIEALLRQYDEHVTMRNRSYADSLARYQRQHTASQPTTPSVENSRQLGLAPQQGLQSASSPQGQGAGDAALYRKNSMSGTTVDRSRDPRSRG